MDELIELEDTCDHLYHSGKYAEAVTSYTRLIELYLLNKSDCLKDSDKESLKDSDKLALIYNNRGHSKYMLVDFYPAKDDFDIAVSLNPKLDIAFYNRATILYRMGDFAPALEDLLLCTKMNPDNLEFAEALKACQQCLEREK